MNQLNSIILEGSIEKIEKVDDVINATISVKRFYKNAEGEMVEEVSYFDTEVYGQLARLFEEKGKIGREIRLVGRLKQNRWTEGDKEFSKVFVVAEHIEFKYMANKSEKTA